MTTTKPTEGQTTSIQAPLEFTSKVVLQIMFSALFGPFCHSAGKEAPPTILLLDKILFVVAIYLGTAIRLHPRTAVLRSTLLILNIQAQYTRRSFGPSAHYCSVCFQAANDEERGCLLVTMKGNEVKDDLTYVIPFFTLYRTPPNISASHLPCIFLVSGLTIWVCSKSRPPCNFRETSSKTPKHTATCMYAAD